MQDPFLAVLLQKINGTKNAGEKIQERMNRWSLFSLEKQLLRGVLLQVFKMMKDFNRAEPERIYIHLHNLKPSR